MKYYLKDLTEHNCKEGKEFPSRIHLVNYLSSFNGSHDSTSYANTILRETGISSSDIFLYTARFSDPNLNDYAYRWRRCMIVKREDIYHYWMIRRFRIIDENGNNAYDHCLLHEVLCHEPDIELTKELDAYWKNHFPRSSHWFWRGHCFFKRTPIYRKEPVPGTSKRGRGKYCCYLKHPHNHRNKRIAADPEMIPFNRGGSWKNIPDNWDDWPRYIDRNWKSSTKDKRQWMHNSHAHLKKADWYEDVA